MNGEFPLGGKRLLMFSPKQLVPFRRKDGKPLKLLLNETKLDDAFIPKAFAVFMSIAMLL